MIWVLATTPATYVRACKMNMCARGCAYVRAGVRACARAGVRTCVRAGARTCVQVCVRACARVCVHSCVRGCSGANTVSNSKSQYLDGTSHMQTSFGQFQQHA